MNVAAGPKLAAAVTNAGGLGVVGGMSYSPEMLKEQIDELKSYLDDKNAPFGIDLLLPQVGGSARKTKYVLQTPDLHLITLHDLGGDLHRDCLANRIENAAMITRKASSTNWSTSSSNRVRSSSSLLSVYHPRPS